MKFDMAIQIAMVNFLAERERLRKASDIARLKEWNKAHPESAKACQMRYNKTAKAKEKHARYAEAHPERIKAVQHNYSVSSAGKERTKRYAAAHPDRLKDTHKRWRERNPEKMREMWRNAGKRRYSTERGRLIVNSRNRIRAAVASQGAKMPTSASKLIGCDWDTLRGHLQSLFTPEMNFSNYGSLWHVDHIKPVASFDLNDPEQMRACFHYSNLQPLLGRDNLRKGCKLDFVHN